MVFYVLCQTGNMLYVITIAHDFTLLFKILFTVYSGSKLHALQLTLLQYIVFRYLFNSVNVLHFFFLKQRDLSM